MNLAPGSGVQLTPWGFSALGDASGAQPGEFAPGVAPVVEPTAPMPESQVTKPTRLQYAIDVAPAAKIKTGSLKPKDVLRLARARVREIRAELKRHAALQKELTQLENMLKAAKPLASVRALDTAHRRAI
jgi:hypothetical protein